MALSKLAVRRLTKLADYMASLPRSANKHFNMVRWFDHYGDDEHDELRVGAEIERKHMTLCGTTACALGWAATMPYFRKAGLRVIYQQFVADITFKGKPVHSDETRSSGLLDLTPEESQSLFGSAVQVRTPKQWAKHCRAFLKSNGE